MEKNNEQLKVAETNNKVEDNTQIAIVVDNTLTEKGVDIEQQKQSVNTKKPLTPYQKYKNSRNQNGKKYFEFYDDIKVYTHNIYDW